MARGMKQGCLIHREKSSETRLPITMIVIHANKRTSAVKQGCLVQCSKFMKTHP
jgi:hypothetical protein